MNIWLVLLLGTVVLVQPPTIGAVALAYGIALGIATPVLTRTSDGPAWLATGTIEDVAQIVRSPGGKARQRGIGGRCG